MPILNLKKNQKEEKSTLKKEKPGQENKKPIHFKVLLSWQAPERLFKKRSREYFSTIGAIVFLLVVILLLMKEWLLILVIISLTFVAYVMASIPPGLTEHQITTKGIRTGEKLYTWEDLKQFWFIKRWDQSILNIESQGKTFPRRLIMLVNKNDLPQVKKLIGQYLPLEEPEENWMDNASHWLSEKIPLEKK